MDRNDPAYKGQAGYNPFLLAIYDPWVLGFMARAVWRCPTPPVVERYRRNLGRRHLDVGPGTGYFIEKAAPPPGTEVTLLDPNPHVLRRTSQRLAAMHPTTVEADVMKPLPVDGAFDSAALNYVLHCLRGPDANKAIAIRNVADVLTPDGVLFGGTVLGSSEHHTPQARAILRAFNRRGAFDNLGDTAAGLRQVLGESFQTVEVVVIGSVAHFTATGPRPAVSG
jgi:SAM-dependent methyltransferase